MGKGYSTEEIREKLISILDDSVSGMSGVEVSEKMGINRITMSKYLKVLDGEVVEMTKQEKDILYLEDEKKNKNSKVKTKTDSLMKFTFKTIEFELTNENKINWLAYVISKDVLTYPIGVTASDLSEVLIADIPELLVFFNTAMATGSAIKQGGRDLHTLVNASTTLDELLGIEDNR